MGLETRPYNLVTPTDEEDYKRLAKGEVDIVLNSSVSDVILENETISGFNTNSYMTARMAKVTRFDQSDSIKVVAVAKSQGEDLIKQVLKGN